MLIFMVDISKNDPYEQIDILKNEVTKYNENFLLNREYIVVINKIDLIPDS